MARSAVLMAASVSFAMLGAGCASGQTASVPVGGENAGLPAWFVEQEAKLAAVGQPDLSTVPRHSGGSIEAQTRHLDVMEQELRAARDALLADPRSAAPAAADAASVFDAAARDALERARR